MTEQKPLLGWREWVELPSLKLGMMKAKVDTGARTSCLHAFLVERADRDSEQWARFCVHPVQGDQRQVVTCEAPIIDRRRVTDSGGHAEDRYVIKTPLRIGDWCEEVEFTLTARDTMRFRLLIGRTAMKAGGFLVDPARSYQMGTRPDGDT
jgi:hypothetical protein